MNIDNEIILKLVLSIVIGGAIGLEREFRSKSAGFRTLILVCLGAPLLTIFSKIIGGENPDRIAANLVVGIGFLGAGVIFKAEGNIVIGITTAASMWVTAALGMALGEGSYLIALIGCGMVLTVLMIFQLFERYFDRLNQMRNYKITYPFDAKDFLRYELIFKKHHLKILTRSHKKSGNSTTGYWTVLGAENRHHQFIEHILKDASVSEFEF